MSILPGTLALPLHVRRLCVARGLARLVFTSVLALAEAAAPSPALAGEATVEGAFISFELQIALINEGFGLLFGIAAGWRSHEGYVIGGAIYDLLNGTPIPEEHWGREPLHTKLHFGGVVIGKLFETHDRWFGGTMLLGLGDVSTYSVAKKKDGDRSWYLIAQPTFLYRLASIEHLEATAELNVRLVAGIADGGTSTSALSGPAASIAGSWLGH